jgi:phosphoglycolate phosphatase-like HAD superfamily hydrolase
VTRTLHGIDLVIFDKDGTLIEFSAMWSDWATGLASALRDGTGLPIEASLFSMFGFDLATGRVLPGGGLAATPMARLRERTRDLLVEAGSTAAVADMVLTEAWHAPDPVELARPITDLGALFGRLRASGRRIAVATSDDREPAERTLAALGVTDEIDAIVCADDGVAVKPAPDMVLHLCEALGVAPDRTAVVGDAPADLAMGRRAGAGLVIGVLSGVGDAEHLSPAADLVLQSVADLQTD